MSTNTKNLLFLGVLILIMVGLSCIYLFIRPRATFPSVATSTASSETASNLDKNPAAPQHIIENGQYYQADMQYPSETALANTAQNAAAVTLMKNFVVSTLQNFKQDTSIASITPQAAEDEGLGPTQKYELSDEYQVYYGSHTVSYAFTISEDTLGAHPNENLKTFNFDSRSGASLSLSDLFTPGSDYLNQLSTISRADLTKQQGSDADPTDFIDPGTTPTASNFENFVIDGTNLTILFAPYSVASYAQGEQTVEIPLSQLKNELKSAYQ